MDGRYQAALAELTQSLLASSDLPTLMQRVVMSVVDTLPVEQSALWALISERNVLALRAAVGWSDASDLAVTAPIRAILESAAPVVISDWPDPIALDDPSVPSATAARRSCYVAIQGQGYPFGMLGVKIVPAQSFSDDDRGFFQVVANLVALGVERSFAKQMLEQAAEKLAVENARLVAAAQDKAILEERQRLARELHDSVTQALYGVTLHAEAAARLLASGDVATAATNVRVLQDTAQEALDEMRLLIFELRPPVLEQVGLAAALQARLNAVEGRANLLTRLSVEEIGTLPTPVEEALYRISQEALNNALRHARAQRITVQLRQVQSWVILEIIDDGVGFDPATVHEHGGLGLRGIAERVSELGGTFALESAPGAGTHLRVEVAI